MTLAKRNVCQQNNMITHLPKLKFEILNLFANSINREIISWVHKLALLQYSSIIDETQDIEGTEEEAICVRYVDHHLVSHEAFFWFYNVSCTTGENLAKIATDVLLCGNLLLSGLRGQTYDGAADIILGPQAWQPVQIVRQIQNKICEHCNCSIRDS